MHKTHLCHGQTPGDCVVPRWARKSEPALKRAAHKRLCETRARSPVVAVWLLLGCYPDAILTRRHSVLWPRATYGHAMSFDPLPNKRGHGGRGTTMGIALRPAPSARCGHRGLVPDRKASADCGLDNGWHCARRAHALSTVLTRVGCDRRHHHMPSAPSCDRNAFASEYLIPLRFGLLLLCDPV
jgi:hypothetical protein